MRLRLLICGFVLGMVSAILSGQDFSPEADDEEAETERMMRLWQKYALPGRYHENLEAFVGEWDTTTKIWMEGPENPPMASQATISSVMIFGDRFLQSKMRGSMSFEMRGQVIEVPFEAIGYVGYDNFKQKYVSVWIDSAGTAIYYAEGLPDKSGTVFTYYATMDEWETGQHDKPYKMVDRIVDEDTCVTEMFDLTMAPGETKVMEMVAKRKSP
ncbi:MAG: DUF1579 domain-containing protein [Planctomycetota bacterium]|jgi:hypothetical protein